MPGGTERWSRRPDGSIPCPWTKQRVLFNEGRLGCWVCWGEERGWGPGISTTVLVEWVGAALTQERLEELKEGCKRKRWRPFQVWEGSGLGKEAQAKRSRVASGVEGGERRGQKVP